MIESNVQKNPLNTLNNLIQPHFSLFNDADVSYLPVPALKLMIGSTLSDTKHKLNDSNKNSDNNKLLLDIKPVKCRKNHSSISNISTIKQCQVNNKNNLQYKFMKSDNVKFSDLSPVIPLSVLDYLSDL